MSRFGKKIRSKLLHIVETKISKEELLQMVDHRLSVNQQFEHIQSDVSAQALMRAVESRVEEKKLCSRYLMTKEETRDSIIRYTAINMLNKKVFVFGNIATVTRDEKNTVKITGWLLPRCNYDRVEIWSGGLFRGDANLDRLSRGALEKYQMFHDDYAGFEFRRKSCVLADDIVVKIYKDDVLIDTLTKTIEQIETEQTQERLSKEDRIALLRTATTVEERITIYQDLYHAEQFDADLMKEYCDLIDGLENPLERYWLGVQDLPWINFFYPECMYDDYYVQHRELVNRTIKELYKGDLGQEPSITKRVAITVNALGDSSSAASALFRFGVAQNLLNRGYDVKIFVADLDLDCGDDISISKLRYMRKESTANREWHTTILPERCLFYNEGENVEERLTNYINAIDAFRPEYILDISWEHALALPILQEKYKVLQSSISGFCTSMMVDKYITYNREQCMVVNERYHSVQEKQIAECPVYIDYDVTGGQDYKRSDYYLPEDAFILITVGKRMQYELTEDFFEATANFLKDNPNFIWIIVGRDIKPSMVQKQCELFLNRRIIFWGFEERLANLYGMCDAYIDPDRQGGGGSVIMAMKKGLPVVMTDRWRDVTAIIKRENCIAGSYEDLYREIKHLAEDKEHYQEASEKMLQLVSREDIQLEHYVDVIEETFQSMER
ncbi:MAG: glycosyltransferase family 4 protein [Lachnospiraceae bacterium]|nr:glycosyltransferase family 4 protein [Lachnospiraceae bacterium]